MPIEFDLSVLTPDEMAQFEEVMRLTEAQTPLSSDKAAELSGRMALERFQAGTLNEISEQKYTDMFNRVVREGYSEKDAAQFVAHNREGDQLFQRVPEKIRQQVYTEMQRHLGMS